MQELTSYIKSQSHLIENELDRLIPKRHGPCKELFDAARHSLLGGGKRLRPILALAIVDMLNGDLQQALTSACTLEIVHTYSLIHDDLPCMDDDDFRRGKPTVHKMYSEGHAVLTGDYLLTYAFEILATLPHVSAEKKVKLITTLSQHIGSEGMIGGQVMDIANTGKTINLDTLKLIHRNKTGALITASVEFGAILANANPIEMEHIRNFGEHIGLAFQIIDDVLDVTSSEAKHGRKVATDVINNKVTYVSLLGIERSHAYAMEHYAAAIKALKIFPKSSLLVNLADFIIQRNH